jgi:hypothetical protein
MIGMAGVPSVAAGSDFEPADLCRNLVKDRPDLRLEAVDSRFLLEAKLSLAGVAGKGRCRKRKKRYE